MEIPEKVCLWDCQPESVYTNRWTTSCGNERSLDKTSPQKEGMKYCMYCGGLLITLWYGMPYPYTDENLRRKIEELWGNGQVKVIDG